MNGIGVSAVTAYTAHREWASRPPDERYASVHALYDAARARRLRTEERTIETVAVRTEAVASDALALRDTSGRQAALTNWSLAARRHRRRAAEVPPNAARRDRVRRDQLRAAPSTSRAAAAPRRPRRTVDRPRGYLSEVRAGPPRRAGRPGARPHGPAPGLVPAARLQGRCVRR